MSEDDIKDDGGAAFPSQMKVTQHDPNTFSYEPIASGGMSLREWYAGLAMQGLLAFEGEAGPGYERAFAVEALRHADALIEELKKE